RQAVVFAEITQPAQPNMIYVYGLVNSPAPQIYTPGTQVTVLQAIAGANGLRTDLTPRQATLIRRSQGKDVHVKLNMDRLSKGQDENIVLAGGDILYVPPTFETVVQDFFNRTFYLRAGATASYAATGSKRFGDDKSIDTTFAAPTPP
ncbi:MAG: hypothetical protein HQ546_11715, partial [Planctomycetes bacterium]|nr:hypothetical protein [Planctomycetota bacterium]